MITDLQYHTLLAKRFLLLFWIKESIIPKPGNFISSKVLYKLYIEELSAYNPASVLDEISFYKEFVESLAANNLTIAKARQQGKRGFNGIEYQSSPNWIKTASEINLHTFKKHNLIFDVHLTKLAMLFVWVNTCIHPTTSNHFISTKQLYDFYKADIHGLQSEALLSKLTFYKEIQKALFATNLLFNKARKRKQKGFTKIQYSNP